MATFSSILCVEGLPGQSGKRHSTLERFFVKYNVVRRHGGSSCRRLLYDLDRPGVPHSLLCMIVVKTRPSFSVVL